MGRVRESTLRASVGGERGIVVCGHAVDRLVERHLKAWKRYRVTDEGLHTWASRVALSAYRQAVKRGALALADDRGRLVLRAYGIQWVIEDGEPPVLVTVV